MSKFGKKRSLLSKLSVMSSLSESTGSRPLPNATGDSGLLTSVPLSGGPGLSSGLVDPLFLGPPGLSFVRFLTEASFTAAFFFAPTVVFMPVETGPKTVAAGLPLRPKMW